MLVYTVKPRVLIINKGIVRLNLHLIIIDGRKFRYIYIYIWGDRQSVNRLHIRRTVSVELIAKFEMHKVQ